MSHRLRHLAVAVVLTACGAGSDVGGDAAPPVASAAPARAGACSVTRAARPLPDRVLDGTTEDGTARAIRVAELRAPCTSRASLLVVRVHGGAWCGTCRWHAEHTRELFALPGAERVRVLDVVLGDRDNAAPSRADLLAHRALLGAAAGRTATVLDPGFAFASFMPTAGAPLPLVLLSDARTLDVVEVLSNPSPGELAASIARALAAFDGAAPPPAAPAEPRVDGRFTRNEWDLLREVTLPGEPPADPSNAVADAAEASALGRALFHDARLSPSGEVSCATCHDPRHALADGRPRALGVAEGARKTPRIALAAHARWQTWDGRADSLWAQALGPLEDEAEMGSDRLHVVRQLAERYAAAYAGVFPGAPLPDVARLPPRGKPGTASYDGLDTPTRESVTRAFVNAGKALAAYERTFRVRESALDRYVAGDASALTPSEKLGLDVFVKVGCMQCHWGPRLTDDAFHVLRLPTGRRDGAPDPGRAAGLALFAASPFRSDGPYSDGPRDTTLAALVASPRTVGAFKTPSLRGVAHEATFSHGGTVKTLAGMTEVYGAGERPEDPATTGAREPWLMHFDEATQWAIVPFLATLTAEPVVP